MPACLLTLSKKEETNIMYVTFGIRSEIIKTWDLEFIVNFAPDFKPLWN